MARRNALRRHGSDCGIWVRDVLEPLEIDFVKWLIVAEIARDIEVAADAKERASRASGIDSNDRLSIRGVRRVEKVRGQFLDGRGAESPRERDSLLQFDLDLGADLDGHERVAAEMEKIVANADWPHVQTALPNRDDRFFDRCSGCDDVFARAIARWRGQRQAIDLARRSEWDRIDRDIGRRDGVGG